MHFIFAWRYFRGKYAFQAIQIIAWVSIFAIAIGTAALITILSVSNGFTDVVKGLYSDFYADIRVVPTEGKFFKLSTTQILEINKIEGVKAVSKVIENRALIVKDGFQSVALVKGVENSYGKINNIKKYLKRGETAIGDLENPMLIMGIGVEQKLGLFQSMIGDSVQIYAVNRSGKSITQVDQLNSLFAKQSGAFSVQQEFDEQYVFTNAAFAQYLFDLAPDQVSAIELSIDGKEEKNIRAKLNSILGAGFLIQNKYQQNADLYNIMELEKWIIFAILALVMLVASFNLVGTLTMLVIEKQKDIQVLTAMGATEWGIQKIFLSLSAIMSLVGALIGGGLASIFIALQYKFHLIKLQGNSFVIDYYPIKPMATDYLAIMGLVIFISLLAGWIPSKRAAAKIYRG